MSLVAKHAPGLLLSESYREFVASFKGGVLPVLHPPLERRTTVNWPLLEDTGHIRAVGGRKMPKRLGWGLSVLIVLMVAAFSYGALTR